MSWASLASNQFVSFSDAASSGIPLNSGQSHTYSDKFITKDEALTKYNCDPSYLTSFSGNQWVTKDSLVSGGTPIVVGSDTFLLGYSDGSTCSSGYALFLYWDDTNYPGRPLGTPLYNDSGLTFTGWNTLNWTIINFGSVEYYFADGSGGHTIGYANGIVC